MQDLVEEEDCVDGESGSDDSDGEGNAEEASIPASWNQHFSSEMTVNDGHDSAWEYHQNQIAKNARYPDKKHLQDAIINWALSTHNSKQLCHLTNT